VKQDGEELVASLPTLVREAARLSLARGTWPPGSPLS
jgi:hypothetical protein